MNNKRPKITIITITYNSEATISETIQSVVSQNYDDLEYIIIDGGSVDNTLGIANGYRDKIARVISEPDEGISDAFNKGIRLATGEIIGIINSDDLLADNALNCIASVYSPTIDVYSGNVLFFGGKRKDRISKPDTCFDKLKLQYGVAHPGRFIRKDAYEKWGMYSIDLKYKMDIDLLVRFYRKGACFYHIDQTLAKFRLGGTTSTPIAKKKRDYFLFVTRNGWSKTQFWYIWIEALLKDAIKRCVALFGMI